MSPFWKPCKAFWIATKTKQMAQAARNANALNVTPPVPPSPPPHPDMKTKPHTKYMPTDWTTKCEAKCRKDGRRCPHRARSRHPNTIAAHSVMDGNQFQIVGRGVYLCESHSHSFSKRAKRLLSLPLIDYGHLSPYNEYGYGSVVVFQDRIDFQDPEFRMRIPAAWPVKDWSGNVPDDLYERLIEPVLAAARKINL